MKLQAIGIYRRFWWPHPYAREAGLLWVKRVVDYRYQIAGRDFNPKSLDYTRPIPKLPDELLTWRGKEAGEPRPGIIWID